MNELVHIYWHPDCFKHETGEGCYDLEASPLIQIPERHPENADRLRNIKSILERGPIQSRLNWYIGSRATYEGLSEFADPSYLEHIYRIAKQVEMTKKAARIDGQTTVVSPGTLDAMHAAAGCGLNALNAILSGDCKIAYSLTRPPGHHASRTLPDGYCLVNNIGVVAEHARKAGLKKIAVLDWDVHHGNGTQAGFYDRSDVLTISLHMPLGSWGENHPELGTVDEVGIGSGKGYNLNIPLPYGSGDRAYETTMIRLVKPALDQYQPDLLIIANGQDANQFDLNGRNLLSMSGYRTMAKIAKEIADEHCGGRMLLIQEGGYAVTYTAFCAYGVMEGVLGITDALPDPVAYPPSIEHVGNINGWLEDVEQKWEAASGMPLV
ncbi:MAG: class II histone deacetylase [Pseudomonadota bacterium]